MPVDGNAVVEVFKALASLSLLPKCAWGLNKQLHREVKVVTKVIVRKGMTAAMFRAVLTTKIDAAAYLSMLPETVHSLALDASQCQANLADLALPARLRTLRLTHLHELPALPASLTSITLESCSLAAALELPASLTDASLVDTSCCASTLIPARIALVGPSLRVMRLLRLQPAWNIEPLPHGLTDLYITYEPPCGIPGMSAALTALPQSLEALTLSSDMYVNLALGALPHSLKTFDASHFDVVHSMVQPLPESLTQLSLSSSFNHALGALPRSLQELRITNTHSQWGTCVFDRPLGPLPPSLHVVNLAACVTFNHALGRLPDALRELRLGPAFDQPLPQLPAGLEVLVLGAAFGAALPAALPRALRELHMGHHFNAPLALPPVLEVLIIGNRYTHRLDLAALPLRVLRVGGSYRHALPLLPRTCVSRAHPLWL
ncbi:hypothetical protein JKP88DRAFT_294765 [Tribonema minus]|uniref:Uncharacterized protein n=1 Tax=Tribonema minus TaxID=303371 RepID=A0A835ZIN3_9STRA|nr:hypothetical protein JKP88DRAFT_294765 [Tribonema minus]